MKEEAEEAGEAPSILLTSTQRVNETLLDAQTSVRGHFCALG